MRKAILIEYPDHYWHVADFFVLNHGRVERTERINKFFKVDENWMVIYETVGGSGTGFSAGEMNCRINISDCEFYRAEGSSSCECKNNEYASVDFDEKKMIYKCCYCEKIHIDLMEIVGEKAG